MPANTRLFPVFQLFLVALIAGSLLGCGGGATTDDRPTVVATTTVIADMASVIGGEDIRLVAIMKPGQDPHIYDVLPNDAMAIQNANLVLANGLHLEATLDGVLRLAANDGVKVVYLAEASGVQPLGSDVYEGAPDPHCWMDVRLFRGYAEAARDALIAVDPAHAAGYTARAAAYLAELDVLDAWVREQLATIPVEQRVIITSHDAFNYYAHAYQIEVHGVMGISTDGSVKAQDVERLRKMVAERGIRALFIETSVTDMLNNIVKKIAADTGASIGGSLYSDSLGDPGTEGGTYVGMIRHNTRTIVEALSTKP